MEAMLHVIPARSPRATRILIADCHALARAGLRAMLSAELDLAVVGEAADGAETVRRCRDLRPDLVLMDVRLPVLDGIAATRATGAHFLGRVPATIVPLVVRTLVDGTQLVRLRPSDYPSRRRGQAVLVRLLRYTLDDPGRPGHGEEHLLATSLLTPRRAPAEELVVAYHARWEFELAADELKTHQRPAAPLRSRKPVGVDQEVYALLLAHYVVRAVMADAACAASLPPARLSFLAALRLGRAALPDFQRAAPAEHARLYRQLLADIAAARLPERRDRSNPRVVKRKMSNFAVKGPQHRRWPQPTSPFRAAVRLLAEVASGSMACGAA